MARGYGEATLVAHGSFWRFSISKERGIKLVETEWKAGGVTVADGTASVSLEVKTKKYRMRMYFARVISLFVKHFNQTFGVHAGELFIDWQ